MQSTAGVGYLVAPGYQETSALIRHQFIIPPPYMNVTGNLHVSFMLIVPDIYAPFFSYQLCITKCPCVLGAKTDYFSYHNVVAFICRLCMFSSYKIRFPCKRQILFPLMNIFLWGMLGVRCQRVDGTSKVIEMVIAWTEMVFWIILWN